MLYYIINASITVGNRGDARQDTGRGLRNRRAFEFFRGVRIVRPRGASRRATVTLGIFAILFQAMLFAWHDHAHPRSSRAASAVVALAAATDQEMPAPAEDACQICFALSHHGAAPVDLFAAAPPDHLPVLTTRATAVTASLASYLLFRSRAPPWA